MLLCCLLTAGAAVSCTGHSRPDYSTAETDSPGRELSRLDSLLDNHPQRLAGKEQTLKQLKQSLATAVGHERFRLIDRLSWEYFYLNLDSAAAYARRKIDVATDLGDTPLIARSRINLARILLAQGERHEALDYINSVITDTIHPDVRTAYHEFMSVNEAIHHRNPIEWYRKLSMELDSTQSDWIFNQSNLLNASGDPEGALTILNENRHRLTSIHDNAIADYIAGKITLEMGDTLQAISLIARGAAGDLLTPVRDYKSLYELASLLLATGDIDRAYSYIDFAVEDVNAAKVIDNVIAVNSIMPQIVRAHETRSRHLRDIQRLLVGGISLLSVILICALIMTVRSRNAVQRGALREKSLNSRLMKTNQEEKRLNSRLEESNRVKDAYLVQYFNLCSYFVGRLEQFKGNVSASARSKGLPGVEKLLAATDDEKELKRFYANFDSTFLSLFPDFIDRLNLLLAPDKQVALNRDGSMSNELRTMALIRLGITDSDQIANFLRRSVSTIYNYRVKMRNSATGPRDKFENEVRNIS